MFFIQDPTYTDSKLLLDAILECCQVAQSGGGAYAFVSSDGINLLVGDPVFLRFLEHGRFHLIIGMDEITNSHTLATLNRYMIDYPNLRVRAFLHNTSGSTFHPKFCWFDCGDYGYIITGSGNLTQKGMQRNREAFEMRLVNSDEIVSIKQCWSSWIKSVSAFLFPLDNEAVVQKAQDNIHRMQTIQSQRVRSAARPHTVTFHEDQTTGDTQATENTDTFAYVDDEHGSWEYDATSAVLICEIPRGGRRWNQANFDADTFQTYFESAPGAAGQMALILRDVKSDGSLGEIRHRPPVSVASHNYRIELYVDQNRIYPDNARVLAVFVKLSSRTFLYTLIYPTDEEHNSLQEKLNSERQRRDRLVRYQTKAAELQTLAPSLSILQYLSQAD